MLGGMTIRRMDHVGIVVDDLAAAIAFFVELGLELRSRCPSRDVGWTASSARRRPSRHRNDATPDGHGGLELTKFPHAGGDQR